MNTKQIRGFTLWELLVTVLVTGVILGIGVPNLLEFTRNNAMASTANDLIGALMAARAEAVKRQVFLTLCASPNPVAVAPTCSPTGAGTNGGYIVWVDESGPPLANGAPNLGDASDGDAVVDAGEQVLIQRDDPQDIQVFGDSGYVAFGPNGFRRNVPGLGTAANVILLCDARGNVAVAGSLSGARVVRIDPTGRAQVLREVADITAATTPLGLACP
jgi:prepilin-type N-terminal cleavage/methylation domain-containing protein